MLASHFAGSLTHLFRSGTWSSAVLTAISTPDQHHIDKETGLGRWRNSPQARQLVSAAKPDPGHASVSPFAPCPLHRQTCGAVFAGCLRLIMSPPGFIMTLLSFLETDPNRNDWKYKHRCISWQVKIENYTEESQTALILQLACWKSQRFRIYEYAKAGFPR